MPLLVGALPLVNVSYLVGAEKPMRTSPKRSSDKNTQDFFARMLIISGRTKSTRRRPRLSAAQDRRRERALRGFEKEIVSAANMNHPQAHHAAAFTIPEIKKAMVAAS